MYITGIFDVRAKYITSVALGFEVFCFMENLDIIIDKVIRR
jgi:hypothetical protein